MRPVEVTARWEADGSVTPLEFRLAGRLHAVDSVGRSWTDETGLHILVMAAAGQVFELLLQKTTLSWQAHFPTSHSARA